MCCIYIVTNCITVPIDVNTYYSFNIDYSDYIVNLGEIYYEYLL